MRYFNWPSCLIDLIRKTPLIDLLENPRGSMRFVVFPCEKHGEGLCIYRESKDSYDWQMWWSSPPWRVIHGPGTLEERNGKAWLRWSEKSHPVVVLSSEQF